MATCIAVHHRFDRNGDPTGVGASDQSSDEEYLRNAVVRLTGQLALAQLDLRIAYELVWLDEAEGWSAYIEDFAADEVEVVPGEEWVRRRETWSDEEYKRYGELWGAFYKESYTAPKRISALRAERAALWKVLQS